MERAVPRRNTAIYTLKLRAPSASQTGDGEFISHAEFLDDGTDRFVLRDNSGNTIVKFIGCSVPFDTWFHYDATYDQATNQVDVHINGS